MSIHFHTLKVSEVQQETPDCISVCLEVPEPLQPIFTFSQGQNITLKKDINGESLRRSYSICSSPLEKQLRVAIKKVEGGKFSTWANEYLKKGETIDVLPPTGKFYTELNAHQQKNYLAFAAGSGITPILSIIKTTLATEPHSSFTLVYGNRNSNSIIFKEALEALKNKYMERFVLYHVLSREKTDAEINYGRIDADKCAALANQVVDFSKVNEVFICGPESMIFSVRDFLAEQGIDKKHIHFELFNVPGAIKDTKVTVANADVTNGLMANITIKSDGRSVSFDLPFNGKSILDAALEAGADLPFACKGGVCCTCRAKLITGEVNMDVNYALEPEELAAGYILTCQSHPSTSTVMIDFDSK